MNNCLGTFACGCCGMKDRYRPSVITVHNNRLMLDLALVFAMKEKRQIRKLVGKILDTPNLSRLDMDLIRDAVDLYNKSANEHDAGNVLTFNPAPTGTILDHTVISRRRKEYQLKVNVMRSTGRYLEPARETKQRQRTNDAREGFGVLIKAVERMDREHKHLAETRRQRAVASMLEPDDKSLSYVEDTAEKENVGANPYVDIAGVIDFHYSKVNKRVYGNNMKRFFLLNKSTTKFIPLSGV